MDEVLVEIARRVFMEITSAIIARAWKKSKRRMENKGRKVSEIATRGSISRGSLALLWAKSNKTIGRLVVFLKLCVSPASERRVDCFCQSVCEVAHVNVLIPSLHQATEGIPRRSRPPRHRLETTPLPGA